MIKIKNLHVSIEDKEIIKGASLEIAAGEIHAIMGPNGAGKSTLAKVLAGDPTCVVTDGQVLFHDQNILELEPEERAHLGIFMSFQYPIEIPGVSNRDFLRVALNSKKKAKGEPEVSEEEFDLIFQEKMKQMQVPSSFKDRAVNEGFSGGEKKRNEILQMAILDPLFCILDETDSGLDIDAMRTVADGINALMRQDRAVLLITHYQRLLNYVKPDVVHVMIDGKIWMTGDASLAKELEQRGYEWVTKGVHNGAGL